MTIRRVGAEAAPLLAALHAEAFPPPQRWGAEAMALLLDLPGHLAQLVSQPRRADQQIGRILRRGRHDAAGQRGGERQSGQPRTGKMAG